MRTVKETNCNLVKYLVKVLTIMVGSVATGLMQDNSPLILEKY